MRCDPFFGHRLFSKRTFASAERPNLEQPRQRQSTAVPNTQNTSHRPQTSAKPRHMAARLISTSRKTWGRKCRMNRAHGLLAGRALRLLGVTRLLKAMHQKHGQWALWCNQTLDNPADPAPWSASCQKAVPLGVTSLEISGLCRPNV